MAMTKMSGFENAPVWLQTFDCTNKKQPMCSTCARPPGGGDQHLHAGEHRDEQGLVRLVDAHGLKHII
eukprot:16274406-Heterocapsa_arctica.AAC.1